MIESNIHDKIFPDRFADSGPEYRWVVGNGFWWHLESRMGCRSFGGLRNRGKRSLPGIVLPINGTYTVSSSGRAVETIGGQETII
jgi:hypothetical protein